MAGSLLTAGALANQIRKECGIAIFEENSEKTVFTKEELLIIVASITIRKKQAEENNLVKETVKATIHEMRSLDVGN